MSITSASVPGSDTSQKGRARAWELNRVGWIPDGEVEYPQWVEAGRYIGALGRGSQWWIGDWIRYGTARWGEKYAEAARITGYDPQSLRNIAYVTSRFDLYRRRYKLTWTHHAELAALDIDQQEEWLDRAITLKLSARDLRAELRSLRRGEKGILDDDTQSSHLASVDGVVCPNCGHTVSLAADPVKPLTGQTKQARLLSVA
jgi:hypothetical protein